MIFLPEKLPQDFELAVGEEMMIEAPDGELLSGILFRSEPSKGLIFYLHGNAGSLRTWSRVALVYMAEGYDVFMLDYRGFGKSEGEISSQEQFYGDIGTAYDVVKKQYSEAQITILGYSIGTGPAEYLASTNDPKQLILEAPYFNLSDMMDQRFPFLPGFLLKYKFATNEYLRNCKVPVTLIHGDADQVIYYGSSLKLKELFKPGDRLITLKGQGHIGISDNPEYRTALNEILN